MICLEASPSGVLEAAALSGLLIGLLDRCAAVCLLSVAVLAVALRGAGPGLLGGRSSASVVEGEVLTPFTTAERWRGCICAPPGSSCLGLALRGSDFSRRAADEWASGPNCLAAVVLAMAPRGAGPGLLGGRASASAVEGEVLTPFTTAERWRGSACAPPCSSSLGLALGGPVFSRRGADDWALGPNCLAKSSG